MFALGFAWMEKVAEQCPHDQNFGDSSGSSPHITAFLPPGFPQEFIFSVSLAETEAGIVCCGMEL